MWLKNFQSKIISRIPLLVGSPMLEIWLEQSLVDMFFRFMGGSINWFDNTELCCITCGSLVQCQFTFRVFFDGNHTVSSITIHTIQRDVIRHTTHHTDDCVSTSVDNNNFRSPQNVLLIPSSFNDHYVRLVFHLRIGQHLLQHKRHVSTPVFARVC